MLKDYIIRKFSKANKELRLTQYFASNKFLFILAIVMFIFATLITNIGVNIIDNIFGMFNGNESSLSLLIIFKINMKYSYAYAIIYIIFLLAYIKLVFNIRASYKDIKSGQKGTSRFAYMEEMREQYIVIPEKDEEFDGSGGIPIIRDGEKILIDDSNTNNMILGITRSGKGEYFVLPMIDIYSRSRERPSLVFADPKGELTRLSYKMLIERGYDVKVINLLDLDNTTCYNPLQLIINAYKNDDLGEAQLLAKSFTFSLYHNPKSKEPMWESSAMSLVNGLILAICEKCLTKNKDLINLSKDEIKEIQKQEKKVTLFTVANLLSDLGSENTPVGNALDLYFNALPKESIAKQQYATSKFSEGKTRASIFTVAMDKLQIFTLEKVAKFTSQNDINLYDIGFGDKPIAIFLIAPDYDKSLHSLNTILINQLYYVLAKEASFTVEGKCKRKVKIVLDEFGNSPALDNIDTITTVCLGRNIEFTFILQSYSQLEEVYGKGIAKTIEGNCGNHIYLMSSDDETSEKFSKMIGETTITVNSRSGNLFSLEKNQTESLDRRRLLDSSELRRLKTGELVVVRSMKRTDLKGNKIEPYPIYVHGENSMKFRFEYLKDLFEEDLNILDLKINDTHTNIDVEKLKINLDDEIEEIMHQNYMKQLEVNAKYSVIAQDFNKKYMAEQNAKKQKKQNEKEQIELENKELNKKLNNEINREAINDLDQSIDKIDNEVKVVRIDENLIRKIRSSSIIKGSITKDGLSGLSSIVTLDEIYKWIGIYSEGRIFVISEINKILRKEGYIE